MAQRPLSLNIEYFPDPSKGKPIALGNVYVGIKDTDPEIEANRVSIVVVEEDGTETTIAPAAQPLNTGAGGVILYNGDPVVVLVDGVTSVKVTNSLGVQEYYVPRANDYLDSPVDTGLLVPNGSFENTTVAAALPDNWDVTETSTGTIVIDDTDANHGNKSLKFTSIDASGAGEAVMSERFSVSPDRFVNIYGDLKSTAIDTRTLVSITWYDLAGSIVTTDPVLDEQAANPTSWDSFRLIAQAPATAYSAVIKIEGMKAGGVTTSGSTWFDNIEAFVSSTYHAYFDANAVASPWLFTGLPAGTKTILVCLHNWNPTVQVTMSIQLGDKNGLASGSNFRNSRMTFSTTPAIGNAINTTSNFILSTNNMAIGQVHEAIWTINAVDILNFGWSGEGFINKGNTSGTVGEKNHGSGTLSDYLTQLQVSANALPAAGSKVSVTCHV